MNGVKSQGAVDFVAKMRKIHEEAGAALGLIQETMEKYYDRSRQPAREYQVGRKDVARSDKHKYG